MGKTAVACGLYDLLQDAFADHASWAGVQLISADSAMVYQGMDIGTAKPDAQEQQRYPHHLIDLVDPATPYSAADFVRDADACVRHALSQRHLPIIVGGTMLYVKRFIEGIATLPEADPGVRKALAARWETEGPVALHAELRRLDPVAAEKIHPNNRQRLLRALEVHALGSDFSALWAQQEPASARLGVEVLAHGLMPQDRLQLHEVIERRFHTMLEAGFEEEVQKLWQRGDLSADLPAMRAVGYRQAWQFLQGEISREEFVEQAITATRRLAKRQLTWMRNWDALELSEGPSLAEGTDQQAAVDRVAEVMAQAILRRCG